MKNRKETKGRKGKRVAIKQQTHHKHKRTHKKKRIANPIAKKTPLPSKITEKVRTVPH